MPGTRPTGQQSGGYSGALQCSGAAPRRTAHLGETARVAAASSQLDEQGNEPREVSQVLGQCHLAAVGQAFLAVRTQAGRNELLQRPRQVANELVRIRLG